MYPQTIDSNLNKIKAIFLGQYVMFVVIAWINTVDTIPIMSVDSIEYWQQIRLSSGKKRVSYNYSYHIDIFIPGDFTSTPYSWLIRINDTFFLSFFSSLFRYPHHLHPISISSSYGLLIMLTSMMSHHGVFVVTHA